MEKIKAWLQTDRGKDIMTVLIVVLVGLGSFELGRLSKESDSSGVKVEYPNQEANVTSSIDATSRVTLDMSTKVTGKAYFASSRGQKYYSIGCSGGKTIKQENRIYFTTAAEAEAAGYELSSTCK